VKRLRLFAVFAEENLDNNIRCCPRTSPKVHATQKVMTVPRIVYECSMDAAPTQAAWHGGITTPQSPSPACRINPNAARPFPFRI
jgi:hypothetical protein